MGGRSSVTNFSKKQRDEVSDSKEDLDKAQTTTEEEGFNFNKSLETRSVLFLGAEKISSVGSSLGAKRNLLGYFFASIDPHDVGG